MTERYVYFISFQASAFSERYLGLYGIDNRVYEVSAWTLHLIKCERGFNSSSMCSLLGKEQEHATDGPIKLSVLKREEGIIKCTYRLVIFIVIMVTLFFID